jgi:hypothetical protein
MVGELGPRWACMPCACWVSSLLRDRFAHELLTHLERPACDAAAAFARRQEYLACAAHAAVMLDERSVAAHARLGAVEYRRLAEVILVREPVPVRLVALCIGAQCQHVSRGLVKTRWGLPTL